MSKLYTVRPALLEQSPRISGTWPNIIPIGWTEQKHGFIIFDFHSNGDSKGCNWVCRETRKSFTDSVVDFESVPKDNPTPLLCVLFHSSWSRYRAKKCQPQTARVFRIATLETSRSWTTMLPTLVLVAVCICWGCYSELPQMERIETLLVHYLTVVAVRNLKSVCKDSTEQASLEALGTKYAAFILLLLVPSCFLWVSSSPSTPGYFYQHTTSITVYLFLPPSCLRLPLVST